jgi:hypothetical protein
MANMADGPGPNVLNMLGGSHYLQAEVDENLAAGVALTKIYGPFFYYNNKLPPGTANLHDLLFADAIAQAKAEQAAWPYTWFVNTGDGTYAQESGRATVSGTLAITDPGAPSASPGNTPISQTVDAVRGVWNYSMMGATTWTVNFTLTNAPTAGSMARFYLALASSDGANLTVTVNGTSIGAFGPGNPTDSVVRLGSHGAFWDDSLIFNSNLLKAGANTLTIKDSSAGGTL